MDHDPPRRETKGNETACRVSKKSSSYKEFQLLILRNQGKRTAYSGDGDGDVVVSSTCWRTAGCVCAGYSWASGSSSGLCSRQMPQHSQNQQVGSGSWARSR